MKSTRILQILLFINLIIFGYGFYLKIFDKNPIYNKIVGFGVLWLVFILLPVFLYYGYKDKKIEDFKFKKKD